MEHRASAEGKLLHGRRILHLSLSDGDFVFLAQVKKRLLYHVDKKEILNAQRRLHLGANVRRLSDQEIDALNRHIHESGSDAVVNGSCQLLALHDTEKLYHYIVQLHGHPPHEVQYGNGSSDPQKTGRWCKTSDTLPTITTGSLGKEVCKEERGHVVESEDQEPVSEALADQQPDNEGSQESVNEKSQDQQLVSEAVADQESSNKGLANRQSVYEESEDMQPVNKRSADEQPVHKKLANQHPVNGALADQQPLSEKYVDQQPVSENFVDQQPGNKKSKDQQPDCQKFADQPMDYQKSQDQHLDCEKSEDQPLDCQKSKDQQPDCQKSQYQQPVGKQLLDQDQIEQAQAEDKNNEHQSANKLVVAELGTQQYVGETWLKAMVVSLNDKLRSISDKVSTSLTPIFVCEQKQEGEGVKAKENRPSDVNNNKQDESSYQPESTWQSELGPTSPSNRSVSGIKRRAQTKPNDWDCPPEKSPSLDQTKALLAVYEFHSEDGTEVGELYPCGKPAKIVKRRTALHMHESPYQDDPDFSTFPGTLQSKATRIGCSKTPKTIQSQHKLSQSKSKVRVFGSKLAHSFHRRHFSSNTLNSIIIKTVIEDVRRAQLPDSNATCEVGKLVINGVRLAFITIDGVRYVAKRELYRHLLPPSKGLYGTNNFRNLCKTLGLDLKIIDMSLVPTEIIESFGRVLYCHRSVLLISEDQVIELYTQYLRYADKKKKQFCPRIARQCTTTKAADTTTDVIDLLQTEDIRIDNNKPQVKDQEDSQNPETLSRAECIVSKADSQPVHSPKQPPLPTGEKNKSDNTSLDTSLQNPSRSLPAMCQQQCSMSSLGTNENTSSMMLNTLTSSDCTTSTFIKSNYEVLAQDPYVGPLASAVDLMNSTVEELGIRKTGNASQWGASCYYNNQSKDLEGRQNDSHRVLTEENNNVVTAATSFSGTHNKTKDFSSQTGEPQVFFKGGIESDHLAPGQEEISHLRRELEQARMHTNQLIQRCDTTESLLNDFCSSHTLLQEQIKKFVGLNRKIASSLVCLVGQVEQEKEATKMFTDKVQALGNRHK